MDPATRDFQPPHHTASAPNIGLPHVSYAQSPDRRIPQNDLDLRLTRTTSSQVDPQLANLQRTSTWGTRRSSVRTLDSTMGLHRRKTRLDTIRSYHPPMRPGWEPGAEPGIDTSKETEDDLMKTVHAECDITVVDYSADHIKQWALNNETLEEFLEEPKPTWAGARLICVNGISWDVIKLLGNNKGFHRLAIEDMINTKNRTKADW